MKSNAQLPFFRTGPTVYFFRQGREPNGPIKIGYTTHVKRRYHEVFSHHRKMLAILATIPGDEAIETKFHLALAGYEHEMDSATRSDGNSEWFIHPKLEAFARRLHKDDALIASLATITAEEIRSRIMEN
jgi:hypothetical protein